MSARVVSRCPHCAVSVETPGFCCAGCELAAAIISGAGLDRYYAVRTAPAPRPGGYAAAWSDVPVAMLADGRHEVCLHVGGLACASCAWVAERVVLALPGVEQAHVSPTTGRARVVWDPRRASLDAICTRIAAIGYRPRAITAAAKPDRDLLLRVGVAAFCAMNVMLLSAGLYAGWFDGIAPREAALLRWISLAIATPAALWSAEPLLRGAWGAIRQGVLSVDLPVALGIVAMYVHGVVATIRGEDAWLDSMTMLVALLLGGRLLEQGGRRRAVEAAQALAGVAPAVARRLVGTTVERVPASQLSIGDQVVAGLGEQVAADGVVEHGGAHVRMAIVTGESEPVRVGVGDRVVAGAVVEDGAVSIRVVAVGAGTVVAKMAAELHCAADRPTVPVLADRMAPWFTVATLALAAVGWRAHGASAALAVLVVACPCALALAAPLTTASGLGAAARRGLLIRSGDALRRLAEVDIVAFDKTGTLTLGEPVVVNAEDSVLRVASALARYSMHPVSRALVSAAAARAIALPAAADVYEAAGQGIVGIVDGKTIKLSRGTNGVLVEGMGEIELCDVLRPDVGRVISELRARGLRVALLSGDHVVVAERIAHQAGISEVIAGVPPHGKVAWIQARRAEGHRVLFVGDGVNDGPALAAADVAIAMGEGAASSVLVADGVLIGDGLAPISAGLRVAVAAKRAMRAGVARALAYNVAAVAVALAGWMNPLLAAVLMPVSSAVAVWGARRVDAE